MFIYAWKEYNTWIIPWSDLVFVVHGESNTSLNTSVQDSQVSNPVVCQYVMIVHLSYHVCNVVLQNIICSDGL